MKREANGMTTWPSGKRLNLEGEFSLIPLDNLSG